MELVQPTLEHLPAYRDALLRGWAPDNTRPWSAREDLAQIETDPEAFLRRLDHRNERGTIILPDGTSAERIPGYRLWMWTGEVVGTIGLRWQEGTTALPPHCLGHLGYSVVPWQQGRGHATEALRQILPHAALMGLPYVELTTDPENRASQKVIEKNRGRLVEEFTKPPAHGGGRALRWRILLP